MEGKRRDAGVMLDRVVVEEGMMVKFPLVPFASFAAPALRFYPPRES